MNRRGFIGSAIAAIAGWLGVGKAEGRHVPDFKTQDELDQIRANVREMMLMGPCEICGEIATEWSIDMQELEPIWLDNPRGFYQHLESCGEEHRRCASHSREQIVHAWNPPEGRDAWILKELAKRMHLPCPPA